MIRFNRSSTNSGNLVFTTATRAAKNVGKGWRSHLGLHAGASKQASSTYQILSKKFWQDVFDV
jgi:hypothetical protein